MGSSGNSSCLRFHPYPREDKRCKNRAKQELIVKYSAKTDSVKITEDKEFTKTKCVICLDSQECTEMYGLPCSHTFHSTCINQWLKIKTKCPVCRHPAFHYEDKIDADLTDDDISVWDQIFNEEYSNLEDEEEYSPGEEIDEAEGLFVDEENYDEDLFNFAEDEYLDEIGDDWNEDDYIINEFENDYNIDKFEDEDLFQTEGETTRNETLPIGFGEPTRTRTRNGTLPIGFGFSFGEPTPMPTRNGTLPIGFGVSFGEPTPIPTRNGTLPIGLGFAFGEPTPMPTRNGTLPIGFGFAFGESKPTPTRNGTLPICCGCGELIRTNVKEQLAHTEERLARNESNLEEKEERRRRN